MKFKNTILAILLVAAFASCRTPRYIYSPVTQNMPFLQNAGDHQLNAYYSTNGGTSSGIDTAKAHNGLDFHGAVAVSKHWALTGSLSYRWEKESTSDNFFYDINTKSNVRYKRINWEAGGGYFSSIHSRDKVYIQIFAGVGAGRYTINDHSNVTDYTGNTPTTVSYKRFHEADVIRFYLNPVIQFNTSEFFKLAVGARLMNVNYRNIQTDYTLSEQDTYRLTNLRGKTFSFFEPAVDMKFNIPGAEWIRPNIQFSFASGLENHDTRGFNASFGLSFHVPRKK